MLTNETTANSFSVMVDLPVQLRCRTTCFYSNDGRAAWVLFNFDHGMCVVGGNQSYDGGLTYHWNQQHHFGVREAKGGLQFFDLGYNCWKFFDEDVQTEYAGYKLEHELK
jgi:hypothetical protein